MRLYFLRFPEGKDKALTLSYDDGVVQDIRLIEIMESMPIPLFSNVIGEGGDEDVKAVLKDYARRIKTK